ncbi:hypothetical protein GO308_13535 [Sphingomonas sp. SFZ2018-12]|uniref:hypothetical protein n=1 Tax=Sphingomonas sp. SFZ2018-12 TaxID=2683197 RepID=UPI001F0F0414|nr:hypothetical protein [Sphingomonas sp. SFZ2018-12]MCH4894140.1 hypothetical protein [Sphingomonas sp. SFZ2018-12]
MSIETTREKILYLAIVPIVAAAAGAFITSLIQGQTCLPAAGADLLTILKDRSLNGEQKLQALELYSQITGRPWTIVSSVTGTITGIGGFALMFLLARRQSND